MADLQQHFIFHRLKSPQQASEHFEDITGDEYNRLSALAEKLSKDAEEVEEEDEKAAAALEEAGVPEKESSSLSGVGMVATSVAAILGGGIGLYSVILRGSKVGFLKER